MVTTQREIKFQVVENNKIVAVEFTDTVFNNGYWSHWLIADGKEAIIRDGGYKGHSLFTPPIRRQYTGLHDRLGKEIYEGDLIIHDSRNGDSPHPIIYHLPHAAFCGDYGLKYPLQESELDEIRVVGNIYENPELVKE